MSNYNTNAFVRPKLGSAEEGFHGGEGEREGAAEEGGGEIEEEEEEEGAEFV